MRFRSSDPSPFDALEGFSDAVASKEVLYEFRRELSDEQREQLGRKLSVLQSLTANSRMARANRVRVTVTYPGQQGHQPPHG